jgi:hypothetical protein
MTVWTADRDRLPALVIPALKRRAENTKPLFRG